MGTVCGSFMTYSSSGMPRALRRLLRISAVMLPRRLIWLRLAAVQPHIAAAALEV